MGLFVYFSKPYACHQRCCGLLGAQKDGALRGAVTPAGILRRRREKICRGAWGCFPQR